MRLALMVVTPICPQCGGDPQYVDQPVYQLGVLVRVVCDACGWQGQTATVIRQPEAIHGPAAS